MWWHTCNYNTCTRGRRASFLILLMIGAWRPKHVEWLCRNKTCTVLYQVGILFEIVLDCKIFRILIVICQSTTGCIPSKYFDEVSWWDILLSLKKIICAHCQRFRSKVQSVLMSWVQLPLRHRCRRHVSPKFWGYHVGRIYSSDELKYHIRLSLIHPQSSQTWHVFCNWQWLESLSDDTDDNT